MNRFKGIEVKIFNCASNREVDQLIVLPLRKREGNQFELKSSRETYLLIKYNKRGKKMKRTVLGLLLFFVVFLGLFGCSFARTTAEGLGQITFELYDSEGSLVATQEVDFYAGDTLLGLLQEEFTVYCADETGEPTDSCDYVGPYGVYIMGINDIHAYETGTYLAFYINGAYATSGIDTTEIADGYVYAFKYETY